jgi:hypothetical protein
MNEARLIPAEVQAGVEANAMFDALRRGDYAAAGRAQERLKELGWYLGREIPTPRRPRREARSDAATGERVRS